jgi:hypothetical protein
MRKEKAKTVRALKDRIRKSDPLTWLLDHRDAVIRAYTDSGPKRAYYDLSRQFPEFRSVCPSENTFRVPVRIMSEVTARLEADRRAKMAIIAAAKRVEPQAPLGAVASIPEIRAALNLDKDTFDRAVISLAMNERIFIHRHAHPAQLTPRELANMVADGEGNYYVGLVIKPHGQAAGTGQAAADQGKVIADQKRQIETLLADLESNSRIIKEVNRSLDASGRRIENLEKAHAVALAEIDRLTRELDRVRGKKAEEALQVSVIPKNIDGWTVGGGKDGVYRLHRKVKGKGYTIYAGKAPLDIDALKGKIAKKERSINAEIQS